MKRFLMFFPVLLTGVISTFATTTHAGTQSANQMTCQAGTKEEWETSYEVKLTLMQGAFLSGNFSHQGKLYKVDLRKDAKNHSYVSIETEISGLKFTSAGTNYTSISIGSTSGNTGTVNINCTAN